MTVEITGIAKRKRKMSSKRRVVFPLNSFPVKKIEETKNEHRDGGQNYVKRRKKIYSLLLSPPFMFLSKKEKIKCQFHPVSMFLTP